MAEDNLTKTPLVSVLMTAYNREKYIGAAIESVLASTLTDFELIIVDDVSTDETVKIAKKYAEQDDRIKLYLNENNLGDYPNRNKAASYAHGKYIKYLDSDDLIYPHGLEVFVEGMEAHSEAAVGVSSTITQEEKPYPFVLTPEEAYYHHFNVKGIFDIGPSGLIFHRARFNEIGGFSGKRFIGDTEINLKLAACWPLVKMSSSLIFWRQHEDQEYNKGNISTGYLELQLPMYKELISNPACPVSAKEKNRIINYYRKYTARLILKNILTGSNVKDSIRLFRKLALNPADVFKGLFFLNKNQ